MELLDTSLSADLITAASLPPVGVSLPDHQGTVYLSGPITGKTYYEARYGWRAIVAQRLAPGIRVLSPMRHEGHLAEEGLKPIEATSANPHFFTRSKIIVEKDKLDISNCDIMLVNFLEATKVSVGSVAEMGMAYAMGKTIIVVMQDTGNPHDHPFVTEPAALRLDNLDDAIYAINSLLSEGV